MQNSRFSQDSRFSQGYRSGFGVMFGFGICFGLMILGFLGACKKKRSTTASLSYTVRVFADDAKTAKLWRDTLGKTRASNRSGDQQSPLGWDFYPYPPEKPSEATIQAWLWSAADSNANDAQVLSVQVGYKEANGQDKLENIGELPVGKEFSREYTVPSSSTITVSAKAAQTGATKTLGEVKPLIDEGHPNHTGTENDNPKRTAALRKYQDEVAFRRVTDAKVSLTVEILKDGVVVGSQQIQAQGAAEARATAGQN